MPCRTHVLTGRAALPMCHSCEYALTGRDTAEQNCSGMNATDLAFDYRRAKTS